MLSQKRLTRRQFLSFLPTVSMAMLGKIILSQKTNPSAPKFSIGDYVESQNEDEEGSKFWERGIIKGIIAPDWHWNATKDEWLYYYEIKETSYSHDFVEAKGEGFEDDLTLVVG